MFSPLMQSIIARHAYQVIGHDALDAFARERGNLVLFFAGDAERLAESDDVAVVLPELERAFGGAFLPVAIARESERELQRRYRFSAFPALVFLRRGEYLGAITHIQDWGDYIAQIAEILTREPSDPPPYRFPEGCAPAPAAADHHH